MRKVILSLLLLLSVLPVFAHRLNEYLEATTISLSRDKVFLELRLTPGVAVAGEVLKSIDVDHDGLISAGEQQNYIAAVARNYQFVLDGRSITLQVTSALFPAVTAITNGTGDIIVNYEASLTAHHPAHQLQLMNAHYKNIAVYLVNCLLPTDTAIKVTGQIRNASQSFFKLDFTTGRSSAVSITPSDHWAVVKTYSLHGIKHILTGYDHLLFLCALVLGAAGLWDLVKIVTAFTIAHSITLTLATFGLAHLPEQVVEPMIAASIVFVAVQNIVRPKEAQGHVRLAVAFFFGLFHGLGFAGGLLEIMHAMPANMIWLAILGFSAGVEAGNQLVLLPLYCLLQWVHIKKPNNGSAPLFLTVQRYASGLVAVAGCYYLLVDLYTCFQ